MTSEERQNAIASVLTGIELKLEQIGSRVNLLTWMVGALATVLLVVGAPSVWMLIRIAAKLGALG